MSRVIKLIHGDITNLDVDIIVNAANSRLAGGGGVDGAIHRAAGPDLLKECQAIYQKQGECPAGNAVLTGAYNLKAKYVLHAAGPVWKDGKHQEKKQLAQVYLHCLEIAQEHQCKSIAFPNISTGVYGFPKDNAASIALSVIRDFFTQRDNVLIEKLYLVCFDDENYQIYYDKMYPAREPMPLLVRAT
ncbi:MAG: O-acetyl-ADP-ribose deacetylase [Spirochaetota bacterium]